MLIDLKKSIHVDVEGDKRKSLMDILGKLRIVEDNHRLIVASAGGVTLNLCSLGYTSRFTPDEVFLKLLKATSIPTTRGFTFTGYFGTGIITTMPMNDRLVLPIVFCEDYLEDNIYAINTHTPINYRLAVNISFFYYDFINKTFYASPGTYLSDEGRNLKRIVIPMPLERQGV